jgi:hypothetical protein
MEFHEIFHGIQWNSTNKHLTDFFMRISHGIPWNSMEFSMEFLMEFHGKFHEFTERFSPGKFTLKPNFFIRSSMK